MIKKVSTIDEYIADYPKNIQDILQKIRKVIHQAVPEAEEAIAYGIPTFKLQGNLVHFGAYPNHIGFYPAPSGISAFKNELAPYQRGKGTLQFPLDQPIPFDLITKITKFRAAENKVNKKVQKSN
jgi:uncharacterized protein YdhG (YjbR/CyaY superfamily)